MKKRVLKAEKLVVSKESVRELTSGSIAEVGGGTSYTSVCSTKAMNTYYLTCPKGGTAN